MKRFLVSAAIVAVIFAAGFQIQAAQAQYTYTTNNGVAVITKYNGSGGAVGIPGTINGLSVIGIGANAFAYHTSLTSVTIPDSVTSIGDNAFVFCTNLTSITIPDSVTSIGNMALSCSISLTSVTIPNSITSIGYDAFNGCASLTSIIIPNSVTNIGGGAFAYCTNLSVITVDTQNSAYSSSEDGVLFNKSRTTLIQYPGGKAGRYIIPSNVNKIGTEAFEGCTSMTGVTIPNSVTSIGNYTFAFCPGLTSVTIPDSVTSIGGGTFNYCTKLTNATIGNRVASIGAAAFAFCTNLTEVYFQGNAPKLYSLDVFSGDDNATVYYLPGTAGWGRTFSGRTTALWNPQAHISNVNLVVQTNQFGFTVIGIGNTVIVIEACTNLANPVWVPVATKTLIDGSFCFRDSNWTDCPARFYRLNVGGN